MNASPSAAFGVLVFSTNQPSTTACSSQSYLYAVDLGSGGQLPSPPPSQPARPPGRASRSGRASTSRPVIVVLPNGSVQSITHKSDTSLTSSRLPVQLGGKLESRLDRDHPLTAERSALERLTP